MKKEEVPQDKSSLESANFKELCYAVNEKGEYITANSSGWTPKTIALDNAIEDINERTEDAKNRMLDGKASPIEYYMESHKMDVGILAGYMGFWSCKVRNHFKPSAFNKLSKKNLQKYADVFEISLEELQNPKLENETRKN